ncbi:MULTISPECIES: hypothetical protein [Pseudomonas]|uniref:hypothetical protein n=1 Tax=Pseudomonas TaxID=286 RepID=UPI00048AE495|nr:MULTISPECIES: hypothetical protein [Pseudomonas]MDD1977597.1 hypothetical protein [Pseudomonas putida]
MTANARRHKAVKVLQGQYSYEYAWPRLPEVVSKLRCTMEGFVGGGVIHLKGIPGCGLTTFLDVVMAEFSHEAIKVDFNFSLGRLTLLDQFAISMKIRSPYEHLKSAPTYMHEYVKYIGLKLVVVDDLDRFVTAPGDSLAKQLASVTQCGGGLTVLYTTQDQGLCRKIEKLLGPRAQYQWLNNSLELIDLYEVAEGFCRAANRATNQTIQVDREALVHIAKRPLQIHEFLGLLESGYAYATLEASSRIEMTTAFIERWARGDYNVENFQMLYR